MAQKVVDHTITQEELEKMERAEKANAETSSQSDDANDNNEDVKSKSVKKKVGKPKKKRGAKYQNARKAFEKEGTFSISEALEILQKAKYANFDESIELHINLGIDPKNSEQRIRFTTSLPHETGKTSNILVISDKNTGKVKNVIYKNETVIEEILKGTLKPDSDFNIVVCHPSKMKDIAKVAKILGPKGLMPSLKTGTVTADVEGILKDLSKGQVEIKNQPNHAVIHILIGKLSSKNEDSEANVSHVLTELQKNSPSKLKKKLIQKVYLCTSMSPSVRLKI